EKASKWERYQPILTPTDEAFEERIIYFEGDYLAASRNDQEAINLIKLLKLEDEGLAFERRCYLENLKETLILSGKPVQQYIDDLLTSDIDLFIICEDDDSIDKFVLISALASLPNFPAILLYGVNSGYPSRVLGLDLGLDGHLSSNIDTLEILARSRSLLKRRSGVVNNLECARFMVRESVVYTFSGLIFNADMLSITFSNGSYIMLSATEVRVLFHFIKHRGILQSRDKLHAVGTHGKISDKVRTIDVTISRLRKKLSYPDKQNTIIQTVHGEGYMFMPSVEIVSSR
ncbi:MAG: response regulator transcription factor, partial [Hymenobacter sp.]